MKTNNIFRKVGSILAEIQEQYQYLSEAPENLNELELELLSANADFLAEHIKVLKKLNLTQDNSVKLLEKSSEENMPGLDEYQQQVNVPQDSTTITEQLIKQEYPDTYSSFNKPIENEFPAAMKAQFDDTEEIPEKTQPDINIPVEEVSIPEYTAAPTEPEPVEQKPFFNSFFTPEAKPLNEKVTVNQDYTEKESLENESVTEAEVIEEGPVNTYHTIINDTPERVPTLNEMMSAQRTPNTAFTQQNKPVTDLKSIINLNDKLLFIKDLFNGYSLAYSEAIEIINRFDSFDAADNFLKTNYSAKNSWALKQATADKFYELLNRRFTK